MRKTSTERAVISRRNLLQLGGGVASLAFFACGEDDEKAGDDPKLPFDPANAGASYFDHVTQVRDAVRKSPDHTRGRADEVVASRDPQLILRFVRDEIALLVPHGALDRAEVGVRWGIEGVLRGGSGTFRERVELLASLYKRAGFTAKVKLATLPRPIAPEVLFRRPERIFAPALDDRTMLALWKSVGREPPAPLLFDRDGADSKALAAALLALLPGARANVLALPSLSLVPVVSVTVEGQEKLAYPYGDLELTDPLPPIVMTEAPVAQAPTAVRVVFAMTTALGKRPLLDLALGADALVGKQLLLRSLPPIDPAVSLAIRADDVHLFVPSMVISSPASDTNAIASSGKTGLAITDRGDVVQEDATGLTVSDVPQAPAGFGADGSKVVNVTVTANAGAFPAIELLVSATDAAGKPVPTLAGSALRVADAGVDRGFVVVENSAPRPRVLLIYDSSASLPAAFLDPAGRATFGQSLAQALEDRVANVELLAVGTDAAKPAGAAWSRPVPADFGESVRALPPGGSLVWTAIRNAAAASPAVIVALTDFQADEKIDPNLPGIKASAAFGAPVVAVAVGDADAQIQSEIAALTGGVTLAADDPTNVTAIVDAVVAILAKATAAPYRLSYRAPTAGAATRQVTVSLPRSTAKAQASYTVPAAGARLPEGGILGLTLSVQIGDDLPIERTLAGLTVEEAAAGTPLTAAAAASIRETLLGTTLLSIEGGAPSTATWVDDYLTGRLSTRPLRDAIAVHDPARILAALEAGFTLLPEGLEALHVPPALGAAGAPVVMERGLRAVLYRVNRTTNHELLFRSDILQSTTLESTAQVGEDAFRHTLEATCRVALGEAAVFPQTTVGLLNSVALVRVAAFSADVSFLPEPLRARWTKLLRHYPSFDRLVPASGAPLAMWAVDPATGSAFAVLEDGSGGGRLRQLPPDTIDPNAFDKVFDFGGLFGMGPYFIVGKRCARIYIRAGNELVPGYVGPPVDANKEACDLVKDLVKDAGFGRLGGFSKAVNAADTLREWSRAPDPLGNC